MITVVFSLACDKYWPILERLKALTENGLPRPRLPTGGNLDYDKEVDLEG